MNRITDAFQMGGVYEYRESKKYFIGAAACRQYALSASETTHKNVPIGIWHQNSEALVAVVIKGLIYERR